MTSTKMKVSISLLGLPGSGKGTQAEYLRKKYGGQVISIGELVRAEINSNHNLKTEIVNKYNKGVPQDDQVVNSLVDKALKNSSKSLVILDNYPFSANQVVEFEKIVHTHQFVKNMMLVIKISPATALNRISRRLICPKCKTSVIGNKSSGYCKKCGQKLVERSDDREWVVKKRINEYLPRVENITKLFKKIGEVEEIDGEKSPNEVKKEIFSRVEKWIN